jgi:hypothetical protein
MNNRNAWRVTYDIVTDESAEQGDISESGFLDSRGNRVAALIGKETPGVDMTLAEAMRLASPIEDSGHWFTEEGRTDHKGDTERRSIHPPRNITGASYGRVSRLLGIVR